MADHFHLRIPILWYWGVYGTKKEAIGKVRKKWKKVLSGFWAVGTFVLDALFVALARGNTVYAGATKIEGSKLAKGTQKLIADATSWLMVLAPVVAGLLIIYFCIRRSAADEMDQKKWNSRIIAAIVSCIGAVLGSATLGVIVGYYQ